MLKIPFPLQNELEMVILEQLVLKDHLVHKIDATVNFKFIRDEVDRTSLLQGQWSSIVDLVCLFKIILLGYIFGIRSERQLVKEIGVNVAYLWFVGMILT